MCSCCWTCRSISVSPLTSLTFNSALPQNSGRHHLLSVRQTATCTHTQTDWFIRLMLIRPMRCFSAAWIKLFHAVFQAWTFLIWLHFKAHAGTAHVSHCLSKLRHTQSYTTGWHLSKITCGKIILALTWKPFSCAALTLLATHWWKGYKFRAVW